MQILQLPYAGINRIRFEGCISVAVATPLAMKRPLYKEYPLVCNKGGYIPIGRAWLARAARGAYPIQPLTLVSAGL